MPTATDRRHDRRGRPTRASSPTPTHWTEEMATEIAAEDGIDPADRPALAGHPLHAPRVRRQGHRPHRSHARQVLRRDRQGTVPALPEGPRQDRRQDSPASPSPAAASDDRWTDIEDDT